MSKVQLAVGQVWKDRSGRIVTIEAKVRSGEGFTTTVEDGRSHVYETGFYRRDGRDSQYDLIELVLDENGWRPWKATADSQCPVSEDTLVFAQLGSGQTYDEPDAAGSLIWSSMGSASIVAYKIAEETCKPAATQPPARRHSHYFKDVSQIDEIDVYRVCDLFEVDDPSGATQHAVKKLLCAGRRGAKDRKKDYQEAIDTLTRRLAMWEGER